MIDVKNSICKKISIIVPIYNSSMHLDRCLKSIINQTYSNIEILLIDDGSTDNSLEICNQFAIKDKRIKVFHKENNGVSAARNDGIEYSTDDYIAFVDSDDYLESDMYGCTRKINSFFSNVKNYDFQRRIGLILLYIIYYCIENIKQFDELRANKRKIILDTLENQCVRDMFQRNTLDVVWKLKLLIYIYKYKIFSSLLLC